MASKLGDKVLLVLAEENEEPVAGALNLIGGDTLFGRLWGCRPDSYYPSLHFEACYYQVGLVGTKSLVILLGDRILDDKLSQMGKEIQTDNNDHRQLKQQ